MNRKVIRSSLHVGLQTDWWIWGDHGFCSHFLWEWWVPCHLLPMLIFFSLVFARCLHFFSLFGSILIWFNPVQTKINLFCSSWSQEEWCHSLGFAWKCPFFVWQLLQCSFIVRPHCSSSSSSSREHIIILPVIYRWDNCYQRFSRVQFSLVQSLWFHDVECRRHCNTWAQWWKRFSNTYWPWYKSQRGEKGSTECVQAGTKIEVSSHAKWYLRSETGRNFVRIPPCCWGDVHKMPGGLPPSDRPTHRIAQRCHCSHVNDQVWFVHIKSLSGWVWSLQQHC